MIVRVLCAAVCAVALLWAECGDAQEVQGYVHEQSADAGYVWPCDSLVRAKVEAWRDLKFGVLLHWGLYSVPGIVESWSICSEDVDWISRRDDMSYDDYKRWYWGLKDSLKAENLDAAIWARIMKDAGMKYMIFTTKHHDGFCTYDSRYTDFSTAGSAAGKDVTREVTEAFRAAGMWTGIYFSKPDWHCPWYWNAHFATPNRRENYKRARHADWWAKYVEYTCNQLGELTTNYGNLDILWLDGGWVSGDEIGLDSLLGAARVRLPGLIAVDRSVGGRNENYLTPERGIPDVQLDCPWESCITLSNDWGWVPNAPYKSAAEVISMLVEVVAKGGCLLLGVGPTANGVIEDEIVERLAQVGNWLKANGEAVYNTRNAEVWNDGHTWFTANKDGETMYAICVPVDGEELAGEIVWHGNVPCSEPVLLKTGETVEYEVREQDEVHLYLPEGLRGEAQALRFVVESE